MKIIGVIEADLEKSPIGTRSRLADELLGEAVLRRTVRRGARSARLAGLHVVVPPSQRAAIDDLLHGLPVRVETCDAPPPAWQALVRSARKWALGGWRGGIWGACWFDEQMHLPMLEALASRESADAVAVIPAAGCLIDPALLEAMIDHQARFVDSQPFVFTQAPPGLAGCLLTTPFLADLARAGHPLGRLFTYRPQNPALDLISKECCYQSPNHVACASARLLADNRRSVELIGACLAELGHGDGANSSAVCRWLAERSREGVDRLPAEIEVELTTRDQLPETLLRPRGRLVGERGDLDLRLLEKLVEGLEGYDDVNLVFGGFGEPLLHPEFGRSLSIARESHVLGLGVCTNALALDRRACELIVRCGVDCLAVSLDANDAHTYRRLHGCDGYQRAVANVEELIRTQNELLSPLPLIVPQLVKVRENMSHMEAFFDGWLRKTGWATITSFNHGAGQRPSLAVRSMAPPSRTPCARLWSRCLVLADGTVVACDQDFAARGPLGNLHEIPLAEIWGSRLEGLRVAHRSGRYDAHPLCPTCDEWHRP